MPSKSKTKGNKFERDIRDFFNETYNTEEFSRTPNSGAIMGRTNWGRNQGLSESVKRTLGSDIIVAEDFPFAVECKHYGDKPNYAAIVKGPDSFLDHWLGEVVFDAINLEMHPLLFFKTNRKGTHFAIPNYFHSNEMLHSVQVPLGTARDTGVMGTHFLNYGPFMITGIEAFRQHADIIKIIGNLDDEISVGIRKKFFRRDDVQELLNGLD